MAKHETSWVLELMDRVSGPARKVMDSVSGITGKAQGMVRHMTTLGAKGDQIFSGLGRGFRALGDQARSIPVLGQAIDMLTNPVTALVAGLFALGVAVGDAGNYQQKLAELSAITGTVGPDLEFLGDKGLEMAAKFGLAAGDTIEAFKLLASNIDVSTIGGVKGLAALQEQTILLSKAAGVDMPLAANTMASAINQFGLEATEASRVVNVLAAGAKFGAAEIPDLAQSLKVAGTAASNAGISIEETVAALEILSQSALKGSEGGTGFRNVLLSLQTKALPGVDFAAMGLQGSLAALAPKLEDAAFLSQAFGRENISAAQILIKNAGALEEMTAKVTGTNVAMEQAAIQTETWRGSMDRFKALAETVSILVGTVLIDMLKPALDAVSVSLQWLIDNGTAIKAVMIALAVVGGGMAASWLLANGAALAVSFGLGVFKIAFMALNAVMAMSPLGWILMAVGALAGAVYYAWNEFEEFRGVVVGLWEAVKVFGKFLYDSVILRIKEMLTGIKGIGGALKAFFSGDFTEAWEIGKKAIGDLSGVNTASKIADMYGTVGADAAKAFTKGYGEGVGMVDPIADPTSAGSDNALNPFSGKDLNLDGTNPGGGSTESKSAKGIEGGGGSKIITMTIGDINMNFSLPENLRSGATEAANQVARILSEKLRNGLALGS